MLNFEILQYIEEAKRIRVRLLEASGGLESKEGNSALPSSSAATFSTNLTLNELGRFAWTSLLSERKIFSETKEFWLQQVFPQIQQMKSAEEYAEFLRLLTAASEGRASYPDTLMQLTIDQSLKTEKNGKNLISELQAIDMVSVIRAYGFLDNCQN